MLWEHLQPFVYQLPLRAQQNVQWLGLRNFLGDLSEPEFQTAGRALQILRWHFDHQFCGRCGRSTTPHLSDLANVVRPANWISILGYHHALLR